jgi:2-keto-4-pentenoate hydratase
MEAPFDTAALARALVSARDGGYRLSSAHLQRPPNLPCAMTVQARAHEARASSVAGWKVAIGPGNRPIAAPLHPLIRDTRQPLSWRPGIAIEVEFAVELGAELPYRLRKNYSRAEIEAAVGGIYLGVEIIDSRLLEGSNSPFELFLADSLANAGYVLGPQVPREFLMGDGPALTVSAGAQLLYRGQANHPSGDPLTPLVAYANDPSDQLGGLRSGQIVTTGSLCGVISPQASTQIDITLNGVHVMQLDMTANPEGESEKASG